MHWKTKAAIFRALSAIPLADHIHYCLQRYVTREWPRPTQSLDQLLKAAQRIRSAAEGRRARFLEIGAGRDLAIALSLRLLGGKHVTCVDIRRLARLPLICHAATHLSKRIETPAPALQSWEDLTAFGIDYVAPRRLHDAATPRQSIDCFYSVDTLIQTH